MSLPVYLKNPAYACYVPNAWVEGNGFVGIRPREEALPAFAEARRQLPQPHWDGHDAAIDCYWKTWEIGFGNLRRPTTENGFIANYIDTAFNNHLFLWDSVFILMFGRYGSRVFDFQRTLDNLYARQHPDGFICREIDMAEGGDCFPRFDPSSTGPNVLAWSEWESFLNTGDRDRLGRVFPVIMGYHQWLRTYRTWQDGTYWTSGWGCGMDNQPRVPEGYSAPHSHAHQAWIDACLQAVLSARLLVRMAGVLGRLDETADMEAELNHLPALINERMWDDRTAFYYDLRRDGKRSDVMSIGAYWALLADVVPAEKMDRFLAHLDDPREFNRPHRVPSLPANHPVYQAEGGYWRGGVWPSTNYMILRGLNHVGWDRLAHEIALNHVANVTAVFEKTGTLWEDYAPESADPGQPARTNFVGWGGVGPVAVLFEHVFGLRPDASRRRLVWDVRLLDGHGVERYPLGVSGELTLQCAPRSSCSQKPVVAIESNEPVEVEVRWEGGRERVQAGA